MTSIIQSVTRTLLVDYAIKEFFDNIGSNFSNFDLFGGCREFDLLVVDNLIPKYISDKYYSGNRTFTFKNIGVDRLHRFDRYYEIDISCLDDNNLNRNGDIIKATSVCFYRIIRCDPNKVLHVDCG